MNTYFVYLFVMFVFSTLRFDVFCSMSHSSAWRKPLVFAVTVWFDDGFNDGLCFEDCSDYLSQKIVKLKKKSGKVYLKYFEVVAFLCVLDFCSI